MNDLLKQLELLEQILTNITQAEFRVDSAKNCLKVDAFLLTYGCERLLDDVELSEKALEWWHRRYIRALGELYTMSHKQFNSVVDKTNKEVDNQLSKMLGFDIDDLPDLNIRTNKPKNKKQ